MSVRQAAIRFGVGVTTATTWVRRFRARGEAAARRQGKKRGSQLDAHADFILALVEAGNKDIALCEIVERLADERGLRVGTTCVWTFLDRRGLTYNVWPAPSASGLCKTTLSVCANVSGLGVVPRPRWSAAHPGPHKRHGVERHFLCQDHRVPVQPSGHLASTARRHRRSPGWAALAIDLV